GLASIRLGGSRRSRSSRSSRSRSPVVPGRSGMPGTPGFVTVAPPGAEGELRVTAIRTITSSVAIPATMCFQRYCAAGFASEEDADADADADGETGGADQPEAD